MTNVRFLFSKDDLEMKTDLEREFGKDLRYSEEFDFIGETIAVYVIPATALAVQVLDFVLTHMVDKDKLKKHKRKNAKNDVKEKRKIEVEGHIITFIDYTPEEIAKVLSALGWGK